MWLTELGTVGRANRGRDGGGFPQRGDPVQPVNAPAKASQRDVNQLTVWRSQVLLSLRSRYPAHDGILPEGAILR